MANIIETFSQEFHVCSHIDGWCASDFEGRGGRGGGGRDFGRQEGRRGAGSSGVPANNIVTLKTIYPNNTRDVYLYIYSVSAYMG